MLAVGSAVNSLSVLAKAEVPVVSPAFGALVSGVSLLQNFGNELGDLAFIMTAADGTDPQVLADAYADIQRQGHDAGGNTIATELSLAQLGVELWTESGQAIKPFATEVLQALNSSGGQSAAQVVGFLNSAYQCATGDPPCYQASLTPLSTPLIKSRTSLAPQHQTETPRGPLVLCAAGSITVSSFGTRHSLLRK